MGVPLELIHYRVTRMNRFAESKEQSSVDSIHELTACTYAPFRLMAASSSLFGFRGAGPGRTWSPSKASNGSTLETPQGSIGSILLKFARLSWLRKRSRN